MKWLAPSFVFGLALTALALIGNAVAQQSVLVPATTSQIAITGTASGAAVKIITGLSSQSIYVTSVLQAPASTSVVTYTYGTGTNCATTPISITGAMTFGAGQMLSLGTGNGAVWVIPQGKDLCVTISTAVAPGSLSFSQF